MTGKRFTIEESRLVTRGFFIEDKMGEFTFSIAFNSFELISYERALNHLNYIVEKLKSDRVRYEEECRLEIFKELHEKNEELKARLYAEKTNTVEVINDYAKQFKRHSAQFSFMIDLAEDLGIDISKLGALDD